MTNNPTDPQRSEGAPEPAAPGEGSTGTPAESGSPAGGPVPEADAPTAVAHDTPRSPEASPPAEPRQAPLAPPTGPPPQWAPAPARPPSASRRLVATALLSAFAGLVVGAGLVVTIDAVREDDHDGHPGFSHQPRVPDWERPNGLRDPHHPRFGFDHDYGDYAPRRSVPEKPGEVPARPSEPEPTASTSPSTEATP